MFESFVITLREGVEAALVLGIILGYLKKTGRESLKRFVYYGLAAGVTASLIVAAGMSLAGFDPENEVLEGTMLLIAAVFVGSMIYWMQSTARNLRAGLKGGVAAASGGWGLALFTFFTVLREGIETVLFLGAAALAGGVQTTAGRVLSLAGGVLGVGLAVLFAVLLSRGVTKIDLRRFFGVTSVILGFLTVRLLAGSAHEFAEVGYIPMSPAVMKVIGYLVRDSASQIITMILAALPVFLVLSSGESEAVSNPAEAKAGTAADRRLSLARSRGERHRRLAALAGVLAVVLALGVDLAASAGRKVLDPDPVPVAAVSRGGAAGGGEVRLPISLFEPGQLHKFTLPQGGSTLTLIGLKRDDGTVGTALDACLLCGPAGYFSEGDNLVCKNCNAPIPAGTVGTGGGCNPIPLPSSVEGEELVIRTAELEKQAGRLAR